MEPIVVESVITSKSEIRSIITSNDPIKYTLIDDLFQTVNTAKTVNTANTANIDISNIFTLQLPSVKDFFDYCFIKKHLIKNDHTFQLIIARYIFSIRFIRQNDINMMIYLYKEILTPETLCTNIHSISLYNDDIPSTYSLFHPVLRSNHDISDNELDSIFEIFDNAKFDYLTPNCHISLLSNPILTWDIYAINKLIERGCTFTNDCYKSLHYVIRKGLCKLKYDSDQIGSCYMNEIQKALIDNPEYIPQFFNLECITESGLGLGFESETNLNPDKNPESIYGSWNESTINSNPNPESIYGSWNESNINPTIKFTTNADYIKRLMNFVQSNGIILQSTDAGSSIDDFISSNIRSTIVRTPKDMERIYTIIKTCIDIGCITTHELEYDLSYNDLKPLDNPTLLNAYLYGCEPIKMIFSEWHHKFCELLS